MYEIESWRSREGENEREIVTGRNVIETIETGR